MTSISEIRDACAKVLDEKNRHIGTAFLISRDRAFTAANIVKGFDFVKLEFPNKKYKATIENFDKDTDCALLKIERIVEDIKPLFFGFGIKIGDSGRMYGYPPILNGAGIFFDGRIQDTTVPIKPLNKPVILFFPSPKVSSELYTGLAGSPLIVGSSVVGILSSIFTAPRTPVSDFLLFTKIQDAINLLPDDVIESIRPRISQFTISNSKDIPVIVVVSALDEELDYLYNCEEIQWDNPEQKDGVSYRRGVMKQKTNIIVTSARSMGLTPTAILTTKALKEWNPIIAAMIGICGGRKKSGLNLGDIVVADKCFHYQYGAYENAKISRELRVENTDQQIIQIAEHIAKRTKVLSEFQTSLSSGWKKPDTILQCHCGPMASADLVVKSKDKLGEALEADRKTIAVDMESYAFMRAAKHADIRWSFVVKSITDFADAKKDDEYREYAKYTAAYFFIQMIENLMLSIEY